ncbi:RmlC-like cupin domain-containing protein [Chytriomyces sp. MP71]|nr:RmlC-like cupin domain-containing protein [Chytriomyces sp. MP71]
MRIQRSDEHKPMPWKNGKGTTLEIATGAHDTATGDWGWRLSAASVVEDGPFSAFPGIDRFLTVYEGGPLLLMHEGTESERELRKFGVAAFKGDGATIARVPIEPVKDLGLMFVRGRVNGGMIVIAAMDAYVDCDHLVALTSGVMVEVGAERVELGLLDTLLEVTGLDIKLVQGAAAFVRLGVLEDSSSA